MVKKLSQVATNDLLLFQDTQDLWTKPLVLAVVVFNLVHFSCRSSSKFYWNFHTKNIIIIIYKQSLESAILHKNKHCILCHSSISLKEGNEPTPMLWYWILKELRTIPVLENRSGARYKIFTSCRSNFFNSQYNNIPLRWLLTASARGHFDYSYACIHQLFVEDFVVEIHHGDILLFFIFTRKQQKTATS